MHLALQSWGLPFYSPVAPPGGRGQDGYVGNPDSLAPREACPPTMKFVLVNYHGASPPAFFWLSSWFLYPHPYTDPFWPIRIRLRERWEVSWLISTSQTTHRRGKHTDKTLPSWVKSTFSALKTELHLWIPKKLGRVDMVPPACWFPLITRLFH